MRKRELRREPVPVLVEMLKCAQGSADLFVASKVRPHDQFAGGARVLPAHADAGLESLKRRTGGILRRQRVLDFAGRE